MRIFEGLNYTQREKAKIDEMLMSQKQSNADYQ